MNTIGPLDPVPLAAMLRRTDRVAELRSACVTIGGGERLLHTGLDQILRRIRDQGMIAGLITNGFLLGKERIERLNDAGQPRSASTTWILTRFPKRA